MHIQSVIELFAKRQNNTPNVHQITKRRQSQKPRFLPGVLLKSRPDSARIFTKMGSDEELVTLTMYLTCLTINVIYIFYLFPLIIFWAS